MNVRNFMLPVLLLLPTLSLAQSNDNSPYIYSKTQTEIAIKLSKVRELRPALEIVKTRHQCLFIYPDFIQVSLYKDLAFVPVYSGCTTAEGLAEFEADLRNTILSSLDSKAEFRLIKW